MQTQSKLCKRDDDGGGAAAGLSLPEDIILEVLLRLPAKDVRRFRCVSKRWRALMSDPAFVAGRRSRSAYAGFIVAMFGSGRKLELRLLDTDGNVLKVFDDVRAAPALLAPTRLDLVFVDRMQLGAMVIDPASGREFTVVGTDDPPPRFISWWNTPSSNAVDDYSFGRAVPSGDYKVLRLHVFETSSSWDGQHRTQWCEVATIMDGDDGAEPTWRQRSWGPSFFQTSFSCEHKATVNGDLYFMLSGPYSVSRSGRNLIATFDLESEKWRPRKIKGPLLGHMSEEDKWRITLTDLKGTLCMIQNVQHLTDFGGHYANIWLLKDPNTSVWVRKYKIQMPDERLLLFTKPLDILIDGRLLLLNMFRKAGNNENCQRYVLQFYNSSNKAFTDLMEMAEGFNGRMAFYTGSLQS